MSFGKFLTSIPNNFSKFIKIDDAIRELSELIRQLLGAPANTDMTGSIISSVNSAGRITGNIDFMDSGSPPNINLYDEDSNLIGNLILTESGYGGRMTWKLYDADGADADYPLDLMRSLYEGAYALIPKLGQSIEIGSSMTTIDGSYKIVRLKCLSRSGTPVLEVASKIPGDTGFDVINRMDLDTGFWERSETKVGWVGYVNEQAIAPGGQWYTLGLIEQLAQNCSYPVSGQVKITEPGLYFATLSMKDGSVAGEASGAIGIFIGGSSFGNPIGSSNPGLGMDGYYLPSGVTGKEVSASVTVPINISVGSGDVYVAPAMKIVDGSSMTPNFQFSLARVGGFFDES
jgi:hypothetical protein